MSKNNNHLFTRFAAAFVIYFSSVVSIAATPYLCTPLDLDGDLTKAKHVVRVATFNAYLNRRSEGQLITDLQSTDHPQIVAVTEIIQRVRPDILLLNEFDYDANGTAIDLLQSNYLAVGQNGQQPIEYPYVFIAESNTGIPSGFDFDNDGKTNGPGDAYGFGFFPGQYGMVVLSRYPIDRYRARTFQHFLWKDMPGALLPDDPTTDEPYDYYSQQELSQFRLSSKSHWDIPVFVNGKRLHLLAAHPTPPVFDGVEDRNGRRNHDEIRFWADYVGGYRKSYYIYDDNGRRGGLPSRSAFVILGDYNADPNDGDSTQNAISQLLTHPAIDNSLSLGSFGGMEDSAKEAQANSQHTGKSVLDTGDFNPAGPGNLRVDYVLPSKRKNDVECGGVFWPTEKDDTRYLVGDGFPVISSDHRLVWIDLKLNNSWK